MSGLTQRAFAEREGVKYSTFTSWLQGRRHGQGVGEDALHFVETSLGSMLGALEVSLPGGMKVRGSNAREVAVLVKALQG